MKRTLLTSVVAATAIFGASFASAQNSSVTDGTFDNMKERSYAQLKVGFADVGLDDSALTLTGTYGLELPNVHPMLSFEADMLLTLADGESEFKNIYGSTTVEASVFGLGGYLVGSYDELQVENLVPYVRVGLAYTSAEVEASNSVASASGDDSSIGLGLGIGARYQVADRIEILAEYNSTDVDVMNIGVHYEF